MALVSKVNAQSFISVLNPSQVFLTQNELIKLVGVQQDTSIQTYWIVKINPIQNYLNSNYLTISLPDFTSNLSFKTDGVYSSNENQYFWTGYNLDGSFFTLDKNFENYLGGIYNASTNLHYAIISLSDDLTILVKYAPGIINTNINSCALIPLEDEVVETEVEDRGECESNNIRVLFLYSPALNNSTPHPSLVAPTIISQINAATLASGLPETVVHFQSAGTVLYPGFIETPNISNDLAEFKNDPIVHDLRDQYYADIVILLTRSTYTDAAGKAAGISVSSGNAYAIAELFSSIPAFNEFTCTHEIGHLLGARHQRCLTCNATGCDFWVAPYHGYLVGENFRTIMHTQNCAISRTRIGRFSSATSPFMGFETGDISNWNTLKIASRADNVACFRSDPPISSGNGNQTILSSINGPSNITNCPGYFPFVATVSQPFVNPLSYLWEISPLGVGAWTTVSTTNSYVIMNPQGLPNWFSIRLTVTDALGFTGVAFKEVQKIDCLFQSDDRTKEQKGALESFQNIDVFPNPTTSDIIISGLPVESIIELFMVNGTQIKDFKSSEMGNALKIIFLESLPKGHYYIKIFNGSNSWIKKVIKI